MHTQCINSERSVPVRAVVLFLLAALFVAKPLIDLLWRFEIGVFTPQRIAVVLAIVLCVIYLPAAIASAGRFYAYRLFPVVAVIGGTVPATVHHLDAASLEMFVRQLSPFLILLVLTDCFRRFPGAFHRISGAYLVVVLVPTVICYLQAIGLAPITYWDSLIDVGLVPRASGGYLHPSGFTSHLLVAYLFLSYYIIGRGIRMVWVLAYLALTLPALMLTLHRTSIAIALTVLAGAFFMSHRGIVRKVPVVIVVTVLALLSVRSLVYLFTSGGYTTLVGMTHGRPLIWLSYLSHFSGESRLDQFIGMGSLAHIRVSALLGLILDDAHSDYIRVLVCYGVLGCLLLYGFIFSLAATGVRTLLWMSSWRSRAAAGTLLLSVIVTIAFSITLETFRYSNLSWGLAFIWAYCGVSVGAVKSYVFRRDAPVGVQLSKVRWVTRNI